MTNEMVLERKSNLVMPSHYVELDREEMAYVDGGWKWSWSAVLQIVSGVVSIVSGFVTSSTGAGALLVISGCVSVAQGVLTLAEVD